MIVLKNIIRTISIVKENDPVYNCSLYNDKGCSHVDGMLCDFPKCSMNIEYDKNKNNEQ